MRSATRGGASLVYVAPGSTGKTTLSQLLGQRFGYLTDETVGIADDGTIFPYPKPLSVRRPDASHLKDGVPRRPRPPTRPDQCAG